MAHICKIIFNATCQSRCVLNVLWSCYLNQRFCKFWIYFSKYYRTLGSWPVTYLSFGPVGIRWYGWQDRREVLHKVSSLCFRGKLDLSSFLLKHAIAWNRKTYLLLHDISSMVYQGEWCQRGDMPVSELSSKFSSKLLMCWTSGACRAGTNVVQYKPGPQLTRGDWFVSELSVLFISLTFPYFAQKSHRHPGSSIERNHLQCGLSRRYQLV